MRPQLERSAQGTRVFECHGALYSGEGKIPERALGRPRYPATTAPP